MPTKNQINGGGVQYYKKLLAALKANIEPLVTLYHWDFPHIFQGKYGGWINETVTSLSADYTKICFQLFNQCSKNVLLAHVKAYRIYDKEFRKINEVNPPNCYKLILVEPQLVTHSSVI